MFLGIDTGGTFTDFIHWDGKVFHFAKRLSTPNRMQWTLQTGDIITIKIPSGGGWQKG